MLESEFNLIKLPFIKLLSVSEPIIFCEKLELLDNESCYIKAVLPNARESFSILDWIAKTICDEGGNLYFGESYGILNNLVPALVFNTKKEIQSIIQKHNPSIASFTVNEFDQFESWIKDELKKVPMEGLKLSMVEKANEYFGKGLIECNDVQSWVWQMEMVRRKEQFEKNNKR